RMHGLKRRGLGTEHHAPPPVPDPTTLIKYPLRPSPPAIVGPSLVRVHLGPPRPLDPSPAPGPPTAPPPRPRPPRATAGKPHPNRPGEPLPRVIGLPFDRPGPHGCDIVSGAGDPVLPGAGAQEDLCRT